MTSQTPGKPERCAICGCYVTLNEEYAGSRCLDPGHWQAAGVFTFPDFYTMARIMAAASGIGNANHPCRGPRLRN